MKGDSGLCGNCGHPAHEHSHDLIIGSDGYSATVSVDNACTQAEAYKEAVDCLKSSDVKWIDISNDDITNPMVCVVKNFCFELVEVL